jgi:integrative and conjugative element protein (TIGR02256 family)
MPKKIEDTEFINSYHRLIVRNKVLNTLNKYVRKKNKNESGGILLGNVYNSFCEIVKATTPNKYDSSGPNIFIRSKKGAQPHINKAWKNSKGTEIYLGEWHTHFENSPKPSLTDRNMIFDSLSKTKMEIEFLFLIIVGLNRSIWVGKQTKERLIELKADS